MNPSTWNGHFVVYVGGYYQEGMGTAAHNCVSAEPTPWDWGNGWAMGDNARNRYCCRDSKKIRKFSEYDQAREAVQKQQLKFPDQEFMIHYCRNNQILPVRTLDEALSLKVRFDQDDDDRERRQKECCPELDVLSQHYERRHAIKLSNFLREYRKNPNPKEAAEAAFTPVSRAKDYVVDLIKAGITVD